MNKIYKLVWCAGARAWRCVAEIVNSRGKPSRPGAARAGLAGAALLAFALPAQAGPPGATQLPAKGQVVAGQALIQPGAGPATLDIVQSSKRAAIDWQSFNIGSAAQVNFIQPSASSVTLNRVLGSDPSQIFGSLTSNGSVYLSNPNGVLFAPGARVDVGAIVATTMGTGKYALANSLATSGTFTAGTPGTAALVGSLGSGGVFTGLGNTFSGMTIATTTGNSVGMFGTVSGTVRDLAITGASIAKSGATAQTNFGLLAGTLSGGTLQNDYTTGSIVPSSTASSVIGGLVGQMTLGTIRNAWTSATITGNGNVGGLLGILNGGTLDTVYATGNVTSTQNFSGGLIAQIGSAGTTTNTISNAYATGNVSSTSTNVGGLVGGMNSNTTTTTVSNAYATGSATSTLPANNVAGLFGSTAGTLSITDSHATGNVSGAANLGGLLGLVAGGTTTLTRTYATGSVTGSASTVGGLAGTSSTFALNINTSFATGDVSGVSGIGGLVGSGGTGLVINDAYATGAVAASGGNAGGLVGTGTTSTLKNVFAAGAVSGANTLGGLMGTATNASITNGYWDSQATGQSSGFAASTGATISGGGARTTAFSTTATLLAGLNSGTSNGTPWSAGLGVYPHFAFTPTPAGTQGISGTAYTATGGAAGSASIDLYLNGTLIASSVPSDSTSGAYNTYVGGSTITGSSSLGGTLKLSGSSTVTGATYTNAPTLSGGNVSGFDIYSGFVSNTSSAVTLSGYSAGTPSTAFGSSLYTSAVQPIAGTGILSSASSFNLDQAATGALLVVAPSVTVSTAQTLPGNLTLKSTSGDVTVNAAITASNSNTLIFDSYHDVDINAAVAVGNAANVIIATGDTAANLTSASANGDYSFGLGASGFAGSLAFGSSAGTATLKIATGGTGAASAIRCSTRRPTWRR